MLANQNFNRGVLFGLYLCKIQNEYFSIKENQNNDYDIVSDVDFSLPDYQSNASEKIQSRIETEPLEIKEYNKWHDKVYSAMQEESFEIGYVSKSENYFRELPENRKIWIQSLFEESKQENDIKMMIGILHIISDLPYCNMFSSIAFKAINYDDSIVKEYGVKAFEDWEAIDAIPFLVNMEINQQWLKKYVDSVIRDLESLKKGE